jgi:N-acetylneuraminic acid mutarotase
VRSLVAALLVVGIAAGLASAAPPRWRKGAPLPIARTEVAAALVGGEIFVVGGFTPNGKNSARVDAYSPATNRWRRIPDLPVSVDHAAAAGSGGRLYIAGGYDVDRGQLNAAFVFADGKWTPLPPMPEARAAAGAAVVKGKLYVVGGVASPVIQSGQRLAVKTLVFDLSTQRWSTVTGPTPREHLGVTALNGRIYALAGRKAGADTNLDLFEVFAPGWTSWRRLPSVPGKRGGTGAAATGNLIVSAGGETPTVTIRTVFAYSTKTRRWRRLANLPTPRHGLGVVASGRRIFVIGGGGRPGLGEVSAANEFLRVR